MSRFCDFNQYLKRKSWLIEFNLCMEMAIASEGTEELLLLMQDSQ